MKKEKQMYESTKEIKEADVLFGSLGTLKMISYVQVAHE